MEYIISILIAIAGVLGFFFFRERKKNISLKADIDLTKQSESSKIVDEKVESAQEEIDKLEKSKDKPVEDEFWKEYTKK